MNSPADPATLYDSADAFYALSPWEWMEETDLLAIRLPGLKDPAIISVMGMSGNHTALALYLGNESFERFNLMHGDEGLNHGDGIRLVLESRQLQAAFAGRGDLDKSELAEIKTLGRKYRGGNWPCFRSFHPGKAPGPVTAEEATWLHAALEQLALVAPRLLQEDFHTVRRRQGGGYEILCREPRAGAATWQDRWIPMHRKEHEFPRPPCNQFLAAAVAKQASAVDVECTFLLLPSPVGRKFGERFYPYLLLLADAGSGMVLGMELLSVEEQPYAEILAAVPDLFLKMCDQSKIRPRTLSCSGQATSALLDAPAKALGIKAVACPTLPTLDRVLASLPF